MQRIKLLITVIIMFKSLFSYAQDSSSITINEFKDKIKNDSGFVILDVRTPQELSGSLGHLSGAINIPVQELEKRMNELDKYKNKKMYVICRSGHRSGIATEILKKHSFNAVNVRGGMAAYRENGKND